MKRLVDIPPVWFLGCGAFAAFLAHGAPLWRFGGAWSAWAGGAVAVAGIALAGWAIRWFRARRTPVEPRQTPAALVSEGPYRINRNPMYTGLALILCGWALWLGALSAFFGPLVFVIMVTRRFVEDEEDGLRDAFGAAAEAFFARTRRW